MKQLYVYTNDVPKSKLKYLTPGKRYKVLQDKDLSKRACNIIDDNGDIRYILFESCAHLLYTDWTKETILGKPMADKLRTVTMLDKEWIPWKSKEEPGHFEYSDSGSIGKFHTWGVTYEEFEAGPGNYSIAIVELEDGNIVTKAPDCIKFED